MASTTNVTDMNIYQRLAKIRKQVEVIQKNREGFGYKYVTEDEILAKITVGMEKYHLSLLPGIVPGTTQVSPYHYVKTKMIKGERIEENVNEILVKADMKWTWVNNDKPEERIIVDWALVGQQADASQAFGSGLTYSDRYFLLKYFNVATPESDPDHFRTKQKNAELEADKMVAEKIIEEFNGVVTAYLQSHEKDSERVKKFVSKYAKDCNYFTITDPAKAQKLAEDFKKEFKITEG